jgi:hypothetical protein
MPEETKSGKQSQDYIRKKVPSQNIQTMVMAIKDRIAADAKAPQDQKLSVKELTSLANAAANLIKPLALADRDALGERKKKAKETVTKTPW